MILEAAIGVCIHEWSKIQYVNKGVVRRSLIGSSTWVIGPLADLSGFHSIYEIDWRQRKYRLSNAHEIRKYFGNYQITNSWAVLRFCFVRTAPFLNITTIRKSGPRVSEHNNKSYWNEATVTSLRFLERPRTLLQSILQSQEQDAGGPG